MNEDDTPRVDCLINESTSRREVHKEVGVVHVFYSNPHMGKSRLRVLRRDLILTYWKDMCDMMFRDGASGTGGIDANPSRKYVTQNYFSG